MPRSSSSFRLSVTTCLMALVGFGMAGASEVPHTASLAGPHRWSVAPRTPATILGWGFNAPGGIASDGTDAWVVNADGNTVTEYDTSTGALVRVLGPAGLNNLAPQGGVTTDGADVWVANGAWGCQAPFQPHCNTINEYSVTTGALVRVIKGGGYHFDAVELMATNGADVFADSLLDGDVTELSVATGALIRVLHGSASAIAIRGPDLFVAEASAVDEVSIATGKVVRVVKGTAYDLNPVGLTISGSNVFVANVAGSGAGSVTEFSALTGHLVRVLRTPGEFHEIPLGGIAAVGTEVMVGSNAEFGEGWMTVLSASSGVRVKQFKGAANDLLQSGPLEVVGSDVLVPDAYANAVTEFSATTNTLVSVSTGSSYGFQNPSVEATDGTDVWVLNAGPFPQADDSVTEFSASTDAVVRVVSGAAYHFSFPPDQNSSMVTDGTDVWVLNGPSAYAPLGSVTEFSASTGALVRILHSAADEINSSSGGCAECLATNGTDVWVVSARSWVTEVTASTGALVKVLQGGASDLDRPTTILSSGADVLITNDAGDGTVTELRAANDDPIRVLKSASYKFSDPSTLASDGTDAWAVNSDSGTITEFAVATGALVRVLSSASVDGLDALATNGSDVWGTDATGDRTGQFQPGPGSVTELSASTGTTVEVIEGAAEGFNYPVSAVVADGSVFVANAQGSSVSVLPG